MAIYQSTCLSTQAKSANTGGFKVPTYLYGRQDRALPEHWPTLWKTSTHCLTLSAGLLNMQRSSVFQKYSHSFKTAFMESSLGQIFAKSSDLHLKKDRQYKLMLLRLLLYLNLTNRSGSSCGRPLTCLKQFLDLVHTLSQATVNYPEQIIILELIMFLIGCLLIR